MAQATSRRWLLAVAVLGFGTGVACGPPGEAEDALPPSCRVEAALGVTVPVGSGAQTPVIHCDPAPASAAPPDAGAVAAGQPG